MRDDGARVCPVALELLQHAPPDERCRLLAMHCCRDGMVVGALGRGLHRRCCYAVHHRTLSVERLLGCS